jgi:membrane associated rhomboid family serine protease
MQMRFGPGHTPDVIKWLLGLHVVVYLLQRALPLTQWFVMEPTLFWQQGQLWRAATYMWLHGGGWHLVGNLLALWMFGSEVAARWGAERFLRFYLISGVGAGVVIALWQGLTHWLFGGMPTLTLGASGAVYAVLLAHSLMWPDRTILLIFPPIPLRALYLIPFLFLMDLIFAPPNISHVGHLGGVLAGWLQLAQSGDVSVTISQLQYRWRRWRMRRKLRAVENDDWRRKDRH